MSKLKTILGWTGVVVLGLVTAVLEDIMYLGVLVEYMPVSIDLTGDLFWIFTVPLAQLMALAITGTAAWFLGIWQMSRLITFWLSWTVVRAAMLTLFNNPVEDVAVYLVWIALWCLLIGLFAHFRGRSGADG